MAALRPPFMANDMKGLYEKVIRGVFPPIPGNYSNELMSTISSMLQVNPVMRPTCKRILESDAVRRYSGGNSNRGGEVANNELLSTIKLIPNLNELSKRLPAANYEKGRGRNKSVSEANSERCISHRERRADVSVEYRRDYQNLRVPGLPPRPGYRQNNDVNRGVYADPYGDRRLNRQNSYEDRNKGARPLMYAGANVLEVRTPKPVPGKLVLERNYSDAQIKSNKRII